MGAINQLLESVLCQKCVCVSIWTSRYHYWHSIRKIHKEKNWMLLRRITEIKAHESMFQMKEKKLGVIFRFLSCSYPIKINMCICLNCHLFLYRSIDFEIWLPKCLSPNEMHRTIWIVTDFFGIESNNSLHFKNAHLLCLLCIRFALCRLNMSSKRDSWTWVTKNSIFDISSRTC